MTSKGAELSGAGAPRERLWHGIPEVMTSQPAERAHSAARPAIIIEELRRPNLRASRYYRRLDAPEADVRRRTPATRRNNSSTRRRS